MELHPLPTKVRTSFDIPALLDYLRAGPFNTNATFADIMVLRNYISRKRMTCTISQQAIKDSAGERIVGYTLTLVDKP